MKEDPNWAYLEIYYKSKKADNSLRLGKKGNL
jgi:hypothetical protein